MSAKARVKPIFALFFILLLAYGLGHCAVPAEAGSAKPRAATERTMRFLATFAYGPALQFAAQNTPLVLPETYELPTLSLGGVSHEKYRGQFFIVHQVGGPPDYVVAVHSKWNSQDAGDLASLTHEMTHWLQWVSGSAIGRMFCDMEQEAYTVGWAAYLKSKVQVMKLQVGRSQIEDMICTDQSPRYWGRPVRL